jgi:hypothetical protein
MQLLPQNVFLMHLALLIVIAQEVQAVHLCAPLSVLKEDAVKFKITNSFHSNADPLHPALHVQAIILAQIIAVLLIHLLRLSEVLSDHKSMSLLF